LRSKATSKRLTLGGANDKLNSLRPYSRATMPPFALRSWTLILLLATVANARAQSPEDHWAWKRPAKPAVPAGVGNPIDAFVRLRLETEGLKVAPPATREHRIRRLTFDLTGLPPTPEEIAAFAKDQSPDAWEKVIDRLLASPRYGERWGRHWLDLARYADTNGYEFDEVRPDAWRYRDYVISSFNDDKPFDRFAIEQLAGDEAFPGNTDAVIATGFNLLGPDMTDASDQAQRRLNTLNDMTDTASLAFLGMTVGCARCHDHKFEPIPQADYFRFQAFFAPATFRKDLPVASDKQVRAQSAAQREYQSLTQPIRDELAVVEGPHRKRIYAAKLAKLSTEAQAAHRTPEATRTGGQQELVAETERLVGVSAAEIEKAMTVEDRTKSAEIQKRLKAFDSKKPAPPPLAMGLTDKPGAAPETHILERGELSQKAAEVQPGFPAVLISTKKPTPAAIEPAVGSTGRRLALASWIASPENPLTARVIVNRLWQYHFGRGIVGTASDFGVRGERPTHPELLDFLATELIAGGWKLKRLHKLMLMSEAYQQSTAASPEALAKDPENRLLSHANRARLEGEAVRDTLLMVSGRLNPKAGGPGIVLPAASGAIGGSRAVPVTADTKEYTRRSVYLFARRNLRLPFLEAFDLPDSNLRACESIGCVRRSSFFPSLVGPPASGLGPIR